MYPNPYNQQSPQGQWNQGGPPYGQNPYGSAAGVQTNPVAAFMTRVYQWMALGLGITGAAALLVQSSEEAMGAIFGTPLVFVLAILSLGMAFGLGSFVHKMSAGAAFSLFFSYAALIGVLISPAFFMYTQTSIAATFFVTAGIFVALTLYGMLTKKDLSGWGTFLFMGLVGLILASIVNLFVYGIAGGFLYWAITYGGVVLFSLLTAYDTQRIKARAMEGPHGMTPQAGIQGATMLYLDFVNLFLYLLRILGSLRD